MKWVSGIDKCFIMLPPFNPQPRVAKFINDVAGEATETHG